MKRLYDPLAILLVPAAAGIALDRLLGPSAVAWWLLSAAAWALWCIAWRLGHDRAAALVLLLSIGSLAGAWHHDRWNLFGADELGRCARDASEPAALEVTALTGPRHVPAPAHDPLRAIPLGDRSRIEIAALRLRDGGHWRPVTGRALLTVDGHLLGVHAGDRLRVYCQLRATAGAQNPGEFDFAAFARGDRQLAVLRADTPDCVTVLSRGSALSPRRVLEELRSKGDALLWKSVRHERSGLAAALLLGAREQLDAERSEAFLQTGTVHLLAISGMHIAILAGSLFYALRLGVLPRAAALAAVAALTVLYTLVTDSQPSAVRAMVLVLLLCLAQYGHRRASAVNCLAGAALVVLALNPADLYSVGAQLSFLAVAGLIWFGKHWRSPTIDDPLARLIAESRPWPLRLARMGVDWSWRMTLASLVVWLMALPLVMARFHLVSPSAVVLTALAWVPVSLALLSGFGVLVLGWLVPGVAPVLGAACDINLGLMDWLVTSAAALPGSHFWVPGPAEWWLMGFYGGLALWWAVPQLRPPRRWCVAIIALWSAMGLGAAWLPQIAQRTEADKVECAFLSVGHGCAVVVHLPGNRTLLYDAGSLGSPYGAAQSVAGYLWSRGITHLDAVVLSHADVDHYNAMPELLKRFSVGVVYVSPVMFEGDTAALRRLRAALDESGAPVRQIWGGERLRAEGVLIDVLHPPRRGVVGSDNANSIVLAIQHAGRRALLTGDLETPGLEGLLAEEPWNCDVLLAPHHGSRLSDPSGFAEWCDPEWVIVSGGHGDDFRDLANTYQARRVRLFHTAASGAVTVMLTRDKVAAACWRDAGPSRE